MVPTFSEEIDPTAGILCRGSPKNSFFGKFGLFSTNLTMYKDAMTQFFNTSQFTLVKVDFTLVNSQFCVFNSKCNYFL